MVAAKLNLAHFPGLPARDEVSLSPILPGDLAEVALFLHRKLNSRLSPETWQRAIRPSWPVEAPNHGYMLLAGGQVVGVQLAFYADRVIDGRPWRFCNVAAWCVAPAHRAHGVRLLASLLAQKGYTFTDLSPSGNVVPLNRRLNFQMLDTASSLVVNWPWPRTGGVRILSDRAQIEARLDGRDLEIFRDHQRACAAHHLVVTSGSESCYVVFRRERRKRLRLFATLLHVGKSGAASPHPAPSVRPSAHAFRHRGHLRRASRRRLPPGARHRGSARACACSAAAISAPGDRLSLQRTGQRSVVKGGRCNDTSRPTCAI